MKKWREKYETICKFNEHPYGRVCPYRSPVPGSVGSISSNGTTLVKARWAYSVPGSIGSQNRPPSPILRGGRQGETPLHPRPRGGALLLHHRHLHSHRLHHHLHQHIEEEEEEARILKGNTSISIINTVINVFTAIPFVYLVVIRTLLGFALVYNCIFIFNPYYCYDVDPLHV
jgi:hypothetical protein